MTNALPQLLRRRRPHFGHGRALAPLSSRCLLDSSPAITQTRTWPSIHSTRPDLIRCYSTGFTSVHGGRPSAEYAKLRKESLESEFGHILGTYSSKTLFAYYRFGPLPALYRAAIISYQVVKLTLWRLFVQDIHKRAVKFRETLIHLGPFYIKLGQALSTRSDILPTAYCQELSKLQDQIPPFSTHVAIKSIESQLGTRISQIFADISPKPIAAASLGQVYKVMQLISILGSLWL